MLLPQNQHPNGGHGEWESLRDGLTSLQQNSLPQNPKLKNTEGLMTLPKKQPLVLTKPSLPLTKGMAQQMRMICMLATKVVVGVFELESVCERGPPKQSDAK